MFTSYFTDQRMKLRLPEIQYRIEEELKEKETVSLGTISIIRKVFK
jgi:hypothetical protein